MKAIAETDLAGWFKQAMRQYDRSLNPCFQGVVTAVSGSAASGFTCSIKRNGESAADGNQYFVNPGYLPAVGDSVKCWWRDPSTAYVLWPLDKIAAPIASGVNANIAGLVIAGNDVSGDITFNVTGAIAAVTILFTLSFARPYPVVPKITLTGIVGGTGGANWYSASKTKAGFTVYGGNGLGVATGWTLNYVVGR